MVVSTLINNGSRPINCEICIKCCKISKLKIVFHCQHSYCSGPKCPELSSTNDPSVWHKLTSGVPNCNDGARNLGDLLATIVRKWSCDFVGYFHLRTIVSWKMFFRNVHSSSCCRRFSGLAQVVFCWKFDSETKLLKVENILNYGKDASVAFSWKYPVFKRGMKGTYNNTKAHKIASVRLEFVMMFVEIFSFQ